MEVVIMFIPMTCKTESTEARDGYKIHTCSVCGANFEVPEDSAYTPPYICEDCAANYDKQQAANAAVELKSETTSKTDDIVKQALGK